MLNQSVNRDPLRLVWNIFGKQMNQFFISHRFFSLSIFAFFHYQFFLSFRNKRKKVIQDSFPWNSFYFHFILLQIFCFTGGQKQKTKICLAIFRFKLPTGIWLGKKTLKETTIFFLFRNWCRQFRISEIALLWCMYIYTSPSTSHVKILCVLYTYICM